MSATDPQTKAPLTGHLIGRQTWQALPASHPLKGVQDALSFDPSVNVNAGDKLLRAQQLAAAGGDAYQANPSEPRGTPSVTPQEALETGWDFYASVQCEDGHWAGDYVSVPERFKGSPVAIRSRYQSSINDTIAL